MNANPSIPPSIGEGVVPVIQADRDAAAELYRVAFKGRITKARRMERGEMDDHATVQAFARHRLAAIALTKEERVNIATVLAYESGVEDGSRTPPVPDNALREALERIKSRFGASQTSGVHAIFVHDSLPEVFDLTAFDDWQFKPTEAAFQWADGAGLLCRAALGEGWSFSPLGLEVRQALAALKGSAS